MTDIHREIRERVDAFVRDILKLSNQAAIERISFVLSQTGAPGQRPRGRGAKRTRREIEELAQTIVDYVESTPGQSVEQMSEAMGVPSGDLSLPIRKLIRARKLRSEGEKRATRYYPAGEEEALPKRRAKVRRRR